MNGDNRKTNRKNIFSAVAVGIIMLFLIGAVILLEQMLPYRYCEECLYANTEKFDDLVRYVRENNLTGNIRSDDNSMPREIRDIMENLNRQYQGDSDYPVFTALRIRRDDKDNMYISIQAKKERLRNRDGKELPDIRCYNLVYVDPSFGGGIPELERKTFYGNWRAWSSDLWSG
ncbi:MAG: hypothetical protein J6O73_09690 [Lachnospiraceae bacterium]|nr:hypothetical protein [Lachnospiraceae bacterium]